jgi:hypothetical protein
MYPQFPEDELFSHDGSWRDRSSILAEDMVGIVDEWEAASREHA